MAHKYHAKPFRDAAGRYWSSRGEFQRFCDLEIMELAGLIRGLTLQPKLTLVHNGMFICTYIADFRYIENGADVYEDFKGMQTAIFKLKKKLVLALLGIDIKVTTAKDLSRGRK